MVVELTVPILLAAAWAYVLLIWHLAPVPARRPRSSDDTFPDRERIDKRLNVIYAVSVVALTAVGSAAWSTLFDWHLARLPRGSFLLSTAHPAAPYRLGGFCAFVLALPAAYPLAWHTLRLFLGAEKCARYALWSQDNNGPGRGFLLRAAAPGLVLTGLMAWYTLTHYVRFEEDRVVVSNWLGSDGTSYGYDRVKYVVQSEWAWNEKPRRSVKQIRRFVVFDDRRVVPIYPDRSAIEGQIWSEEELAAIVCRKSGKPLTEVCFGADAHKLP